MRYLFLVLTFAFFCSVSIADDFNYGAYKPTTITSAFKTAHVIPGSDYSFEGAVIKQKVEVTFTGQHRLIIPEVQSFIAKWVKVHGHPKEFAQLYEYEIEVKGIDKVKHWLPLQNPLVEPFGNEVKEKSKVNLYILYIGAYNQHKVFLVNAFNTK